MSTCIRKAYLIYDDSSSIGKDKRIEYKKLYEQYNKEFDSITMISYNTKAEFFTNINDLVNKNMGTGGTYVSSGLACAYPQILSDLQNQYIKAINVYIIGDGENWAEDNLNALALIDELITKNVNVTIIDIFSTSTHKLSNKIKNSERYKYRVNIREICEPIIHREDFVIDVSIFGNETVARNCETGIIGKATCKDGDTYDRTEGIRIAVTRAIGKDPFKIPLKPVGNHTQAAATHLPFNWSHFKSKFKKVAVNCKNNEEVIDFLIECEKHDVRALFYDSLLEWNKNRSKPSKSYDCFTFDYGTGSLNYGNSDWHEIQGMNVLQWSNYMTYTASKFENISNDEFLNELKRRIN